jgi:hypothetical protein
MELSFFDFDKNNLKKLFEKNGVKSFIATQLFS